MPYCGHSAWPGMHGQCICHLTPSNAELGNLVPCALQRLWLDHNPGVPGSILQDQTHDHTGPCHMPRELHTRTNARNPKARQASHARSVCPNLSLHTCLSTRPVRTPFHWHVTYPVRHVHRQAQPLEELNHRTAHRPRVLGAVLAHLPMLFLVDLRHLRRIYEVMACAPLPNNSSIG